MSNSLQFHGPCSSWNSPGQNTGVGSLSPSPKDLPSPGMESRPPALQPDSLPAELQGSPSSRYPLWWPWVCFLCLWVLLFPKSVPLCHILDSTYKHITWYLSFLFWLTSLNMILSGSIHVSSNGTMSFFFLQLNNILLSKCMTSYLSISLLMDV